MGKCWLRGAEITFTRSVRRTTEAEFSDFETDEKGGAGRPSVHLDYRSKPSLAGSRSGTNSLTFTEERRGGEN